MLKLSLKLMLILFVCASCKSEHRKEYSPWGSEINSEYADTTTNDNFTLSDIQNNGELIMLTLSGPNTYYDYHGYGMGENYLLCEKYANSIGVSLRVEICKDSTDMMTRLANGNGDIAAYPILITRKANVLFCGVTNKSKHTRWAVSKSNGELAKSLDDWFKPSMIADVKREESLRLSARRIQHKTYTPFLNKGKGIISKYDNLFQKYAPHANIDWRLMAAQCYQESGFDPYAKSWAGYCGLMAIMPNTAAHLGIPQSQITEPETNIAASARCMADLERQFKDIQDPRERIMFRLASYNGGSGHIRDAMALTKRSGGNAHKWSEVAQFVLKLREPKYYNDPIVKHGYIRGDETFNYVNRIMQRWTEYGGIYANTGAGGFGRVSRTPQRAHGKSKYQL